MEMGDGAIGLYFHNLDSIGIEVEDNGVANMSIVDKQGQKHPTRNKEVGLHEGRSSPNHHWSCQIRTSL